MDKLLTVQNVYYFFKYVGLATIGMTEEIEHGIVKLNFSKSKMGIFYNICLICLIGLSFGISFTYIFDVMPLITRSFSEKIQNTNHALSIISAIYVLGVFSLRQQSAIKIIRGIYDHQELFSIRIKKIKPILMSVVLTLITNISISIALMIVLWHLSSAVKVFSIVILISAYINNSLFMQYSIILELMNQFFASINLELRELSEHPIGEISQTTNRRLLMKVDEIFESYVSLARLSKDISDFYSEPMWICLPRSFIALLIGSYYFITLVYELGHEDISSGIFVVKALHIFISHVSVFLILNTAAENTVSESKKTGRLVHKCLMSIGGQQSEAESMLNRFSHYLLHEKIRFGVYDLLTLDQSLLMPILGALATYTVALFQFPPGD